MYKNTASGFDFTDYRELFLSAVSELRATALNCSALKCDETKPIVTETRVICQKKKKKTKVGAVVVVVVEEKLA